VSTERSSVSSYRRCLVCRHRDKNWMRGIELANEFVQLFRYETEVPVDDILVQTRAPGRLFFQAKTNPSFGTTSSSEMMQTVEQIVKLWKSCSEGNGSKGAAGSLIKKTKQCGQRLLNAAVTVSRIQILSMTWKSGRHCKSLEVNHRQL